MKDRENNQPQQVHLPPLWCSSICRNAMNEVCVEHCAVKRDCSGFDPKPNLKLADMPRFPLRESANMTREEKFTLVTIYLAKLVDHINGVEEENNWTIYQTPHVAVPDQMKMVGEVANLMLRSQNDLEDKVDK